MWQSRFRWLARQGGGIGLWAAMVFGALAGRGLAQAVKYEQFRLPAGFDAAKQAAVQSNLTSGNAPAAKDLQDWFVSKFAAMTNPAKEKDIHKTRTDLKKILQTSGNAGSPAGHDAANAFLLKHLPRLITGAKPNLHPTVRYNLALLLADLDSVERKGQANPTPLPEARPELLKLLANPKLHDSIRLAALIGASRHAALSADAAGRAEIAQGVLAFLNELDQSETVDDAAGENEAAAPTAGEPAQPAADKKPRRADVATRKRAVKHWLEARAMEALGATEAPTPEVVTALQARLADVNRPAWVRSASAVALGKLKYAPGTQVDMAGLLVGYKSLLESSVEQGATRRELREVIYSIRRGMNGFDEAAKDTLYSLMDAAQQSDSTQMTNAMSKIAEICESKDQPTEARVTIAVKEVLQDWHDGKFSSTLDADAQENLAEDQSSGEGEGDNSDDGGFDFGDVESAPNE